MLPATFLPDTPPESVRLEIAVMTPVSGKRDDLTSHDDALVSRGVYGPGQLIYTSSHLLCSPVTGKINDCDVLSYSFVVTSKKGLKIRVCYGSDMTRYMGEKCEFLKRANDDVTAGDPVLQLNTAWLRQQQVTPVCIVSVMNASALKALQPARTSQVTAPHDILFTAYA
ncbi:PTS glucose transporter subunit IIA [Alteromonas antoniana]|uniref:PTS glucose transporter subunit IIA n=1 Tax=Alteromonas antoniana TaxID=2803813 RepID=UPI001C487558|nr:PTS glucose transporter subunit IIA [Alteromonas antoniana]